MIECAEKIKPINHTVAAIWEKDYSDYPDLIKIPMENGRVITYRREILQPEPQMTKISRLKPAELLNMFSRNPFAGRHVGYKNGGGKHETDL
jgi:hypothetical protein